MSATRRNSNKKQLGQTSGPLVAVVPIRLLVMPDDDPCEYPECMVIRRPELDLCARYHSGVWSPNGAKPDHMLRANDGIVDWLAVEIATRGSRLIKMTWVERDLATMMIIVALMDDPDFQGNSYYEAALRTSTPVTSEHDPRLRGARFRRLAALGRRHYGAHIAAA